MNIFINQIKNYFAGYEQIKMSSFCLPSTSWKLVTTTISQEMQRIWKPFKSFFYKKRNFSIGHLATDGHWLSTPRSSKLSQALVGATSHQWAATFRNQSHLIGKVSTFCDGESGEIPTLTFGPWAVWFQLQSDRGCKTFIQKFETERGLPWKAVYNNKVRDAYV